MSDRDLAEPAIVQIALSSADMPASLRFYTEGLGFQLAGAVPVWGPAMRAQLLDGDARATVWFVVGRQRLVQIEIFTHTHPVPRPLPGDWAPDVHGWTRFGVAVPDFDETLARLAELGVDTITEPIVHEGLRRVCVRDPGVATIIEVMEDGPAIPGGVRASTFDIGPAVIYAATCVPELEPARNLFVDSLGLIEEESLLLHTPELEALWGLPGAVSESFVARGGDVFLEAVRYDDPAGRAKPAEAQLSDQGFMNIALGVRTQEAFDAMVDVAGRNGHSLNAPVMSAPLMPDRPDLIFSGCYLTGSQGESVEIEAVPPELERTTFFYPLGSPDLVGDLQPG